MMGVTDVRSQIMVWSLPTTIAWAVGGVTIAVINLIFGTGGKLVDPLLPLVVLTVIAIFARLRHKPATHVS